jgi:DNA primase
VTPYGLKKCIEKVKAEVPIERYAGEITELRPQGNKLWGLCPLHEERTASFTVQPEPNEGREPHFYCYGCNAGGDVIELCRLKEGGEPWEAMMTLAMRYGVELPERPESWYARDARRAEIEGAADRVRANILKRRMFRVLVLPWIDALCQDPREHRAELERAWAEWDDAVFWPAYARRRRQ